MRITFILALSIFMANITTGQENFNFDVISNVKFNEPGNDCWGYEKDGIEYAIIGSRTNTRIYSLEDHANPVERMLIPGSGSIWRDIKDQGNYLYVTADDGNDGLLIIDMTLAPEIITHKFWQPTLTMAGATGVLDKCHNIYIDENGIAYLAGCQIPQDRDAQGIIILDITSDPLNPAVLGYETNAYAHDVYARGDTMYTSDIRAGEFAIYDVSDKANPVFLGGAGTSSDFTHNAWLSDDGKTLFTTDERPNGFVDAYDISDVENITRMDIFQPEETSNQGVIPHNTHVIGNYLVTSWYTDGVVITDATKPDNMIKVGAFDTYNGPNGNFNGCWGAYPWLPSGHVIVSTITNAGNDNNGGFYILKPTYQRAAYLEGIVTAEDSGDPINMSDVEIDINVKTTTNTDPNGNYKTGVSGSGTYNVTFSHPEYKTLVESVDFTEALTTTLNVQLTRKVSVSISGNVIKSADGSVVPNADVLIYDEVNSFSVKADPDGNFTLDVFEGTYNIVAGAWGYLHKGEVRTFEGTQNIVIELDKGYQDDFIFDHKWVVSGDAPVGIWERGIPVATDFGGAESNPGSDVEDDYGDLAYITGNGGGGAGNDDVDQGNVILSSGSMDLSDYSNPHIHFSYWFFNESGNSAPNDTLTILITNGIDTVEAFSTRSSNSAWFRQENLAIGELLEMNADVKVHIITGDQLGLGHLVEAGFDAFLVSDGTISATEEAQVLSINLSPNPFTNSFTILWEQEETKATLVDVNGMIIQDINLRKGNNFINNLNTLRSGVYFLRVKNNANKLTTFKLVKI